MIRMQVRCVGAAGFEPATIARSPDLPPLGIARSC